MSRKRPARPKMLMRDLFVRRYMLHHIDEMGKQMLTPSGLTRCERLLRKCAAGGKELDLRTGIAAEDTVICGKEWRRHRVIRASVLSACLRDSAGTAGSGSHALRLTGARIVGHLDLAGADIDKVLRLKSCYIDEAPDFTDSRTRSIHLTQCRLPGLDGERLRVEGQLDLNGAVIEGRLRLVNAHISGELAMNGTKLINPTGWTLFAGGLTVDGAVFGRHGLESRGSFRLTGAKLNGGLFLDDATIFTDQPVALAGDNLSVAGRMVCDRLIADGSIRLPGARVDGQMTWDGSEIRARDIALDLRRVSARELVLTTAQPIQGTVDLGHAQVAVFTDDPASWPDDLRLDGFSYESLIAVTERRQFFKETSRYVSDTADSRTTVLPARDRLAWLQHNMVGYRPQPYEQLAAFYRRMGHDDQARIVLLAKQRQRRSTQSEAGKAWSYLLDWSVGYGYRPWLATVWLVALVATGTLIFHRWPPQPLSPGRSPEFSSLAYTVNILLPFGQFVQSDSWAPVVGRALVCVRFGWGRMAIGSSGDRGK